MIRNLTIFGIGILIVILLFEYYYVNNCSTYTFFLELQLFLIYWLCFIYSIYKYGAFHLYTLYLFVFGIFGLYKFFFDLLFGIDFRDTFAIVDIQLSEAVVQKSIIIYTIFLSVLHAFFTFYSKRSNLIMNTLRHDVSMTHLAKRIMLLFYPAAILRVFIEIKFILSSGVSIYILGANADVPIIIKVLELFFQCGYLILLASFPRKRDFIKYSSLYFITDLPYLILGQRFTIVVDLMFMMFYYFRMYNITVRFKRLIIPGFVMIILLQLVALTRRGNEIGGITIWQMIPLFLSSQSTSMYVLPLYMQNMNIPHSYPFILDPVMIFFIHSTGQNFDSLENRSSLGHQLIYEISSNAYFNGVSLGTTQIAELFEFGLLGIILGAAIYAYFINLVNTKIQVSEKWRFASFILITSILAAPRNTYLPNLYLLAKIWLVYLFIIYCLRPLLMKK